MGQRLRLRCHRSSRGLTTNQRPSQARPETLPWTSWTPGQQKPHAPTARISLTACSARSKINKPFDLRIQAKAFPAEFMPPGQAEDSEVLARVVSLVSQVDHMDTARAVSVVRMAFEDLLALANRQSRETGDRETPPAVADLLARLVVRDRDTVLDPACGQGNDLLAAASIAEDVSLVGVELALEPARLAWMRLQMAGVDHDVRRGDAFQEVTLGVADSVILQPPWGLRLSPRQEERVAALAGFHDEEILQEAPSPVRAASHLLKGDFAWLVLAQQALRRDGRAAVVLAHGSLSPRYSAAHSKLIGSGAVEAVIALPGGGIFAHTTIRTAIWLLRSAERTELSPQSLLIVDAEEYFATTRPAQLELTGAEELLAIVEEYRTSGAISAPGHRARVVPFDDLDPQRGLVTERYLDDPPVEAITHPEPKRRLLTGLTVENFKSFGDRAKIDLAPLTLVFGANSAGKSSLIQSLLLLKQSIESDRLITQGQIANLGSFSGIVHRHNDQPVHLGIEYGAVPSWIPEGGTPIRLSNAGLNGCSPKPTPVPDFWPKLLSGSARTRCHSLRPRPSRRTNSTPCSTTPSRCFAVSHPERCSTRSTPATVTTGPRRTKPIGSEGVKTTPYAH